MLLMLLGCLHKGIPMPGPTRFVGRAEFYQVVEVQEKAIDSKSSVSGLEKSIARTAEEFRGQSSLAVNGKPVRFDCSGYVIAVYGTVGISLTGNTKSLHEQAVEEQLLNQIGQPRLGDVVFFDNSYDRNKNGRLDDQLTHIAIVKEVSADGTIAMMHLGGSGITDLVMNLQHPNEHRSPEGTLWNSYLRINKKGETSPRLTGQLFNSYATLSELD